MTKNFEVEYSPPPVVSPVDDDMEFQEDLERDRSKVNMLCARDLFLCVCVCVCVCVG